MKNLRIDILSLGLGLLIALVLIFFFWLVIKTNIMNCKSLDHPDWTEQESCYTVSNMLYQHKNPV